jgi:hypothetical protein
LLAESRSATLLWLVMRELELKVEGGYFVACISK